MTAAALRGGLSPVAAIIALSLAFAAAQGLSYPLLAILQQDMGLSPGFIGVSAAMTPAGILVSSFVVPALCARYRLWTLGVLSALLLCAVYLLIHAVPNPWLWLPLRFLIGVLINFQFMTADLTVLTVAPEGQRGRYVAGMVVIMQIGFAAGPGLLSITGPQGFAPFGIAVVGFALCALVVWMARRRLPNPGEGHKPEGVLGAFRTAPVILAAVAVAAAFEQGALTLMPLYGAAHGVDAAGAARLLTAMILGSVVLTPLAGMAAERFGPRRAMIVASVAAALGAPLLGLAIETPLAWLYLAVWGGIYYAVFTLAFVEIGDRFSGAALVAVNAATGIAWGGGGMLLVPIAGVSMDIFGTEALPGLFALLFAGLAVAAWLRAKAREGS